MSISINIKTASGFSLIELMVVMLIVAILAGMAYPNYLSQMQRSHRADAISALMDTQAQLERCNTETYNYQSCATKLGFTNIFTSIGSYYQITSSNLAATTYVLTATAQGSQAKDTNCTTFSINQLGQKTAASSIGANKSTLCWT